MNFGEAIKQMKVEKKVQRKGWNGKGMFLFQVDSNSWGFETNASGVNDIDTDSFICMKTAGNTLIPWLASQADIQAEDWEIVD